MCKCTSNSDLERERDLFFLIDNIFPDPDTYLLQEKERDDFEFRATNKIDQSVSRLISWPPLGWEWSHVLSWENDYGVEHNATQWPSSPTRELKVPNWKEFTFISKEIINCKYEKFCMLQLVWKTGMGAQRNFYFLVHYRKCVALNFCAYYLHTFLPWSCFRTIREVTSSEILERKPSK